MASSAGLLLLAAGCQNREAKPLAPSVKAASLALGGLTSAASNTEFVGSESCKECHANEFREHRKSRHAATMRPATRSGMGTLTPATGALPDSDCGFVEADGKLCVASPGERANAIELQLALGSGKTGITFISVMDPQAVFEMRSSYFPKKRAWRTTPGHEDHREPHYLGHDYTGETAGKCIHCHAVTTVTTAEVPAHRFQGVGCESCHGPGSAHVKAIRAKDKTAGQMERLGSWGAQRLNMLCGSCHRTAEDAHKLPPNSSLTARFQPYGLMLSECFQKSGDTLSCLTCHTPHTDASPARKMYEAACLRCHSPAAQAPSAPPASAVHGKKCPVNPHSGCIPCHMPQRQALAGSDVETIMADHYIRSYKGP